jgi:hypothetical protein
MISPSRHAQIGELTSFRRCSAPIIPSMVASDMLLICSCSQQKKSTATFLQNSASPHRLLSATTNLPEALVLSPRDTKGLQQLRLPIKLAPRRAAGRWYYVRTITIEAGSWCRWCTSGGGTLALVRRAPLGLILPLLAVVRWSTRGGQWSRWWRIQAYVAREPMTNQMRRERPQSML